MGQQTFKVINGIFVGPRVWEGNLNLVLWEYYRNTLTSLGCLREVTGRLDAGGYSKLVDLGDLTTVGDYLDLDGCHNLKTLGKLTTVDILDVENCNNLVSLGNLTTIKNHMNIIRCEKLASIGNLKSVGQSVGIGNVYNYRAKTPGYQFLERVKHYQSLPLHEALNAIHSKEVQSIPLYRNILLNKLQGVYHCHE